MLYNNSSAITVEEIDRLIAELQKDRMSLIEKAPSLIKNNHNIEAREKEMIKFEWLNDLYVVPLIEFSKRVSMNEGTTFTDTYTRSDYSIIERTVRLRNFLVSKGYNPLTITSLVPKTVEEINLLLQAKKIGFNLRLDNQVDLTNDNRVQRAKDYLVMKLGDIYKKEVEASEKSK